MNQLDFSTWHARVKALGARYIPRRIPDSPDLLRPWFIEGLTPEQGFERFKALDQRLYREWLTDLKQQAAPFIGLTRTAISRFVKSPSDESYRRDLIIDIAFEMLVVGHDALGASIRFFSNGRDTLKIGVYDYLVNGPERFIARGAGPTIEAFCEQERLCFTTKEVNRDGACPYCKKTVPLIAQCRRCHRPHCAICRLTVGQTILCPHCILLLVKKRTTPKPPSEWHIFSNHYVRCDCCGTELRVGTQYDQIRIREDLSIWCEACCLKDAMPAERLIVDAHRQDGGICKRETQFKPFLIEKSLEALSQCRIGGNAEK